MDLTCVSTGRFPAILIDARHCLMVYHYQRAIDSQITWLNANGKPRPSTLTKTIKLPRADMVVGVLKERIPNRVKTALIAGYEGAAKIISETRGKLSTNVWYMPDDKGAMRFAVWSRNLIDQESGSPVLAERDGRTVIVSLASMPNCGAAVVYYIDQIARICRET